MKKLSKILYLCFAWGVYIAIFAGAACFFGFLISVIVGGENGAAIAINIKKVVFPWIIKLTSLSVGLGLLGMWFGRDEALSITSDKKDAEDDLKEKLAEAEELNKKS